MRAKGVLYAKSSGFLSRKQRNPEDLATLGLTLSVNKPEKINPLCIKSREYPKN